MISILVSLCLTLGGVEIPASTPTGDVTTMEVTAYTAGYESTGKTPDHPAYGVTASGAYVEEGRTCACPPSIPFGTEIYVPALDTTYTCEDRGAAITEGHLDLYMEDLDAALQFGRQELEVIIIMEEVKE